MKEGETEESSSSSESEGEVEPEVSNLDARPYQVELLERARERNTIVCLGTGTGKTFISVMLIKEMAHQVRETFKNGGKRTFFVVDTVPLASQQAKVIDKHTDLKVEHYVGEMGVDLWDKRKWEKEFNENNVLVMTAQIFLDLLNHAVIKLSQVNLLIFDECHHAKKYHPYRQIMQAFDSCKKDDYPKIMGLTASVVNKKVKLFNLESEIQDLECTLRSTCDTSQNEEVERFATKPKEVVLTYLNDDTDHLIKILKKVLATGLEFLQDCRVPRDGPLWNAHWYAKFALRECKETLLELGPWACNKAAGYLINDLEKACMFQVSKKGHLFCQYSATKLKELQSVYHNETSLAGSSTNPDRNGQCFIMPKLRELINVLKDFRNSSYSETEQDNELCGIVFVERRYTALVLCEQINFLTKHDHELTFVKSKFVIGHGTGGKVTYSNKTEMNFKKQEEVLRQFRRHEFNLLIATCVVEEGLDIPRCNVVFRFDFPKNFCSYVQSKGRARAKDSSYYILVDREERVEKENELATMRGIEDYLSEMCQGRTEPTEEECDEAVDTDFLPPYIPENGQGARLTMSSSVHLLTWYCAKLPGDRFTHPKPVFKVEELGKNVYSCKLEMPMNCPLHTTIIGPPMTRKNLSKMAAAYNACKELHRIGELDDDLLPVRSLSSDEESELEEEDADSGDTKKAKAGTKKRKRIYERKVPKVFIDSLVQRKQPQYLTVIRIRVTKLANQEELRVSKPCFTDDGCNMFGLLTNSPLPAIRSFKLYPDYGEVTVRLSQQKSPLPAKLTENHLEMVQKFHCFLFTHVLCKTVELKGKREGGNADGYFIVLVKNSGRDLDYERMEDALFLQDSQARLCSQSSRHLLIGKDMVVTKNYGDTQQRRQRFAVVNVRHDLSPSSPFPDRSKAETYEGYFWQRYGERIAITNQPLVEVKDISGRVNFLSDRKQTSKIKHRVICLIPELCEVMPIRASLFSVALMLPSILYRVNTLLLVGDVKCVIAGACDKTDESKLPPIGAEGCNEKNLLRFDESSGIAKMSIDDDEYDSDDYDDDDDDDDLKGSPELISDLKSLFYDSPEPDHPDSALVLKALTTTHSGDAFDLERLEMLGDAFLKLAVSLHLFWTYQDKDEGKLTTRKKNQISNLALSRSALKKSLAGYQQCTQLARDNWCPTGWQISEFPPETIPGTVDEPVEIDSDTSGAVDGETEVHVAGGDGSVGAGVKAAKYYTQVIADKSVADSIEALIGAYLISCGYLGALRFMKFLGLKVLPDDYDDGVSRSENCKAGCYARFWSCGSDATLARDSDDMISRMISGLENFERKSIGYTFRSKLYLLEALTHASYHANRVTPCYQRLEFLGDAILDFLVTQHLYFRHAKLSPGELTDIRQALVNNNIFATIAVKYEYNKYLKQMSPRWFKTIENFITKVEDETEERRQNHVTADPFIIVSEQDEEGFEAPKVLGDIFESVAGAVFLDSGMDLTAIWRVYHRMMRPYIDHYSVHVPINPVRRVYEKDNGRNFSKARALPNGKIECTLRVRWGTFVGKGANYRIAKTTAAKLAVRALERSTSQGSDMNESSE